MTEVPKIVYDRLRAARPERALPDGTAPDPAHPDADLLTALAEQTLSATERGGVLAHLAICADCREVVALALPDAGIVAAPTAVDPEGVRATPIPAKSPWNWLSSPRLAWPGLRWAALAAGVAVAASVLLLHPGKLNQTMPPSANRQVASAPLPAAGPQIASSPVEQSTTFAKTDEARPKPGLQMSKKFEAGKAAPPLQQQSGMLLAYNRKGSSQEDKRPAAPSAAAPAIESGGSVRQSVTESVEVAAAAEAVTVEPSSDDALMARNDAPAVVKAKPALPEEVIGPQKTQAAVGGAVARAQGRNVMSAAKLAPSTTQTSANNVTWEIKAGVLRRSRDNGQSWQNAVRADRPLLCYASRDADIWTGGQAGTLFHSTDSGLTWAPVQPSFKAQALSSDVTRIDIREDERRAAEIVVSTSNNEIWRSADGGQTWQKK